MVEAESSSENICPSCGAPAHAGHAPSCPNANTKELETKIGTILSDKQISDMKELAFRHVKALENQEDQNIAILEAFSGDLDWEALSKYDAHGIAKGSDGEQLDTLLQIIQKGINPSRPFHSMPLESSPDNRAALGAGFGASSVYKDGNFVLVGAPGSQIGEGGVKYVIVNDTYEDVVDSLQKAFPSVKFLRPAEAPAVLAKVAREIIPGIPPHKVIEISNHEMPLVRDSGNASAASHDDLPPPPTGPSSPLHIL